jgi:hypothetical protein
LNNEGQALLSEVDEQQINERRLAWFGGNQEAVNMYIMFMNLSHAWDDIVDGDKATSQERINQAFLTALVYLPSNGFYRMIQEQVLPMWITIVSAYEVANKFEKDKDPHGLEIAHGLRYAAGHIVAYAITVCIGPDKAREVLPDMWKAIYFERFEEYRKEHLDVQSI